MDRLMQLRRRLRRTILARRRPLAALAAASAVVAGLQAAAPPSPARAPVVTAARDLAAGTVLAAGDLAVTAFPPEHVPDGAAPTTEGLVGRALAAPVRAGEPLTDVRVLGASLLDGYPGAVAAPVRVSDAGAVALLRVGDRVDVLAADPRGRREAVVVADRAPVVALPENPGGAPVSGAGGLVVLAVPEGTARALASAAVGAYLSVTLTR